jgi:DUF1680 family protein
MKKLILFSLFLCFLSSLSSKQKTFDKIPLKENPVPVSTIKNIQGFYGHRMNLNRENYIKKFPIDEYVRFIEERKHTEWIWVKAEQHGKWVESAYLSAIQSGDRELLAKVDSILNRIINSQEPEGYVGATAKSYRSPERPLRGMDAYELYFVIHAFITVYEETFDKRALDAAVKLSDYITRYIGPGKHEFWPSQTLRYPENVNKELAGQSDFAGHAVHYSWEGTMLIDPILRLYETTGNKKYLDWGNWIIENIDKWSGWNAFSKLDLVSDGKMGVHELQPYVHSHTFHMNFMGFLRLYRITGDESLFRKVKGAWDDIFERQMFITGGVSVAEHYEHDYVKPLSGHIVETCATMSWMQLTQALLELTGDVKYADAMERLLINHVFAAQSCDGEGLRYHTAPNGEKPNGYFRAPDCCTASGHRVISLLPTFVYAENGKDFYINQYMDSEYKANSFDFKINTIYPENDKIEIVINTNTNKCLKLRIPDWCKNPQVILNGQKVNGAQPGSYCALNRQWKAGDKIELIFPMELHWVKREHHSDYQIYYLPGGEHMYKELPTERVPYALMHGPVVYALDMVWNMRIGKKNLNLEKELFINPDILPKKIEKLTKDMLGPVYQTEASYNGHPIEVIFTPFVNVGQWFEIDSEKPKLNAKTYSYAIWMYDK